MSQILTPGERQGAWPAIGDHDRRIRALEANTVCCIPDSPGTLAESILANPCLSGFWKQDETSGDTAVDSSSGGHNMGSGAGDPPTWAAALTPFNTNAAQYGSGLIEQSTTFGALTGDFTVEIWAYRLTTGSGSGVLFTQGDPASSNHAGVAVYWLNNGAGNQIHGYIGDTTGGPHGLGASTNYGTAAWHYVVMRRASNVWALFVDGVQSGVTFNDGGTNYDTSTGLELGNRQASLTGDFFPGYLAYAATYSCALTDAEIELRYTLGSAGGGIPDGWVLTADSSAAAGWSWQPSTIEVEW